MHKQCMLHCLIGCYILLARLWHTQISPTQSAVTLPKRPHVHYRGCGQNLSNFLPGKFMKNFKLYQVFMCQTVLIFSIYYLPKEKTHFGYEGIRTTCFKNSTRKKDFTLYPALMP